MVQQTQQISPSHILSNNSFSSVQQPPQQQSHFAYQSGTINYVQSIQHPHSSNTFAYPSQYPQNLTSRGNYAKQSNTQNSTHNNKTNHHHHQHNANQHHQNFNKLKAVNSQNSFMTNNKQILNNHRTKEVFDLTKNEKDWPQLTGTLKKNLKNKTKKVSNEADEDDDETVSDEEVREVVNVPQEKTPYLADANQLKKLIKNVNFIKTTVEQHYLTENNLKQQNNNANNHVSGPVSFKDAVLAKPKPPTPQQIKEVKKPVVKKTIENSPIEEKEAASTTPIVTSSSKPKRRSRRSRSKKNRSADDTRKSIERDSFVIDFNLKNDEFPDLSNSVMSKTLEAKTANFLKLFENKLDSNLTENGM